MGSTPTTAIAIRTETEGIEASPPLHPVLLNYSDLDIEYSVSFCLTDFVPNTNQVF